MQQKGKSFTEQVKPDIFHGCAILRLEEIASIYNHEL